MASPTLASRASRTASHTDLNAWIRIGLVSRTTRRVLLWCATNCQPLPDWPSAANPPFRVWKGDEHIDPQLVVALVVIGIVVVGALVFSLRKSNDPFQLRVPEWEDLPGVPTNRVYDQVSRTVDVDALADVYLVIDPQECDVVRQRFCNGDQYEALHRNVFRAARSIKSASDIAWLRRGLAIAAIEGGRFEREHMVERLVYLRHQAEEVGIDVAPYIEELSAVPFQLDSEGRLTIPDTPGLGLELNDDGMRSFCPERIEFR